MDAEHSGGCACGAVRYTLRGEPFDVGLCHCGDCRKETGSAFAYYAKWPRSGFELSGELATYEGRSFCARCGSRLMCLHEDDVEIRLGSLDSAPVGFPPGYELWAVRREPWQSAVSAREYQGNP